MAFDFKKEYKEFYLPKNSPHIIDIPKINYIAVRGKGDPNEADGDYSAAMTLLYGMAYTIKMSYKTPYKIAGFYEYVVPPLEGFWWQDGTSGVDYSQKQTFNWISVLRLPEFVTSADFDWAAAEAAKKKKADFSKVEFFQYDEGLCVQCMHIGSYDGEPETILEMERFSKEQSYAVNITDNRFHHEIYLSDPRKCDTAKLKTVIRHPVKKI